MEKEEEKKPFFSARMVECHFRFFFSFFPPRPRRLLLRVHPSRLLNWATKTSRGRARGAMLGTRNRKESVVRGAKIESVRQRTNVFFFRSITVFFSTSLATASPPFASPFSGPEKLLSSSFLLALFLVLSCSLPLPLLLCSLPLPLLLCSLPPPLLLYSLSHSLALHLLLFLSLSSSLTQTQTQSPPFRSFCLSPHQPKTINHQALDLTRPPSLSFTIANKTFPPQLRSWLPANKNTTLSALGRAFGAATNSSNPVNETAAITKGLFNYKSKTSALFKGQSGLVSYVSSVAASPAASDLICYVDPATGQVVGLQQAGSVACSTASSTVVVPTSSRGYISQIKLAYT